MSWSRNEIKILIQTYEQFPCLYSFKHKDYHNKRQRQLAVSKVVENLREIKPTVTEHEVVKKFANLRSTYAAERKKVLESVSSGRGEEEIYHPSLWYYESLTYLNDYLQVRSAPRTNYRLSDFEDRTAEDVEDSANFDSIKIETFDEFNDDDVSHLSLKRSLSSDFSSGETPCTSAPTNKKSKVSSEGEDKNEAMLQEISEGLKKVTAAFQNQQNVRIERSSEEIMGEFVTTQLKKIKDQSLKEDAQFEIHRILREYLKKN